jgi:hypothetical protein
MTDRILLVTPPDDVNLDGLRILLVDLTQSQSNLVSIALKKISYNQIIIGYVWKNNDDVDWLLDKKHKSTLIIFNADSENEIITGYMAGQRNSYYFGKLRCLSEANDKTLYEADNILNILEKVIINDKI